MYNVSNIVKSIDNLDPVSPIAINVMGILEDQDHSVKDIAGLVLQDPSLAANLLRVVNSAYYGLKVKVSTIQDAITLLGARQIAEMILMHSVSQTYKGESCEGYMLESGELWQNALVSAFLAKKIAEQAAHDNPARIFTAALVRDIGKILLSQHVASAQSEIKTLVQEKRMTFNEAEMEVLGIDHAQLGAMVAENWNFPEPIVNIIRDHHNGGISASGKDRDTAMVQGADAICYMLGIGPGMDGMSYRIGYQAIKEILSEGRIVELIQTTESSRKNLHQLTKDLAAA